MQEGARLNSAARARHGKPVNPPDPAAVPSSRCNAKPLTRVILVGAIHEAAMIPTWMIRELERRSQRREARERPEIPIEAPFQTEREPSPARRPPVEPVVIDA